MNDRSRVYQLIDDERAYQDSKPPRPKTDSETSVAEWLVYIKHFLDKAMEDVYFLNDFGAMENVRKIAGLAVAAMENNPTPSRLDKSK